MAANVQFTDRVTGNLETINRVDEAICEHFGFPADPFQYVHYWFDSVGLLFALDKRGIELRDQIRTGFGGDAEQCDRLIAISKFLEERYHIKSWTTVGKF